MLNNINNYTPKVAWNFSCLCQASCIIHKHSAGSSVPIVLEISSVSQGGVLKYDSGKGLPYSPSFQAPKDGKKNAFRITKLERLASTRLFNIKNVEIYSGVGLDRAGSSGILVLPVCDLLASARGPNLALNGIAMRGGDTLILGFVDFVDPVCATITLDYCCNLCCKLINLDYDGYIYIGCEATVDGYIFGHVSYLDCAQQACMVGIFGGRINSDPEYFCQYCDSRMDFISQVMKL
ncbi:hypothetical protein H5410_061688 [Solanum commersonii]|uniref:Oberon-like PHD finger domain-containing protein n=1 Tax=Solanum commersonii TaxID=4109 RepID=A0A9J5W8Q3_SOLCO|nr:hypothetical protein H5410_061688 [Solanum commersonii]